MTSPFWPLVRRTVLPKKVVVKESRTNTTGWYCFNIDTPSLFRWNDCYKPESAAVGVFLPNSLDVINYPIIWSSYGDKRWIKEIRGHLFMDAFSISYIAWRF